uniref:Uncharacterized protein n=1 Tax=Bursaphelenchus xylophilus TaxID=6326 RepID=A0A1I7SDE5_BURXY
MDFKHVIDDDDDEIQNDETSQQWLMRQLRKHLDYIPDQVLREFVLQQDITPLRNFMTGTRQRRGLFIIIDEVISTSVEHKFFGENELTEMKVEDKKGAEELSHQEVHNQIEQDLRNLENEKKPPLPKSKRKMRRFNSKKIKKETKKKTDQETERKLESETNPAVEVQSEIPNPAVPQPAQPQIEAPEFLGAHTSYVLRWFEETDIPQNKFVFLATRDEILSGTKSEFDKMFITGYCKDLSKYNTAIEIGQLLMDEISFEHKMNLVMQLETNEANTKVEKWQNPENRFENFILDSLVVSFQSSLQRMNTESLMDSSELDVESIEALLKSRVKLFTQSPNFNFAGPARAESCGPARGPEQVGPARFNFALARPGPARTPGYTCLGCRKKTRWRFGEAIVGSVETRRVPAKLDFQRFVST